ncbi:hypothetical protein [Streptosporangium sp. NPDC020145]|uniref:Thioredoxin domain-containing protein n=1 Tax=Streptosporangium jomthongense TaxID=1193683 RepID=A0ABV8F1V7_9ACTN
MNLVLTLGVIRRLRDHTERLDGLTHPKSMIEPITGPGTRPGPFTARTVDAEAVTGAQLAGGLVGFFSPTCDACHEWLPRFAAAARALPEGRRQALAVIVAPTDEVAADMVSQLRENVMVVIERDRGPLAAAFKTSAYPAMCRLGADGAVTHTGRGAVAVPAEM